MPHADNLTEVTIPNFLVKVWNIVEDNAYDNCIHWDDTGFSFHVSDPLSFSKEVLPLFFKHNNLSSFVRQLNMYGFRKVTPLERSGLSRAQSDQEHLEFQHPYFVRGHPELLQHIKRKSTHASAGTTMSVRSEGGQNANTSSIGASKGSVTQKGVDRILDEVRSLREQQKSWDGKLGQLRKENQTLWREVARMRDLHTKQQQIVNKLIQFLLSVVQPTTTSGKRLGKRQLLAIGPEDSLVSGAEVAGPSGEKRSRNDTTVVPPLITSATASNTLEELQKELRSSTSAASAASATSVNTGPIIADVTDELDSQLYGKSTAGRSVRSPIVGRGDVTLSERTSPLGYQVTSPNSSLEPLMTPTCSVDTLPQVVGGRGSVGAMIMAMIGGNDAAAANYYGGKDHVDSMALGDSMEGGSNTGGRGGSGLNLDLLDSSTIDVNLPPGTAGPQFDRFGTGIPPRNAATSAAWNNRSQSQEFSDFLEFMESDLESLRDTLNSSGTHNLNVNSDFLNALFDASKEEQEQQNSQRTNNPLMPQAVTSSASGNYIVGNELALYQAPQNKISPSLPPLELEQQLLGTGTQILPSDDDVINFLDEATVGTPPRPLKDMGSELSTPVVSPMIPSSSSYSRLPSSYTPQNGDNEPKFSRESIIRRSVSKMNGSSGTKSRRKQK